MRAATQDQGRRGHSGVDGARSVSAQWNAAAADQAQPKQPSRGQPPSPPNLRQAYLDALANPGKVTTQGATTPQSNPLGQPSVLNSFLANNPGGQVGNQGFFNTLNKLRSA